MNRKITNKDIVDELERKYSKKGKVKVGYSWSGTLDKWANSKERAIIISNPLARGVKRA